MSSKIWMLKFKLQKGETECFIWKNFDVLDTVKKLRPQIKKRGLMPTSTWVLEYGFNVFEEEYKPEGYILLELSIYDKKEKYG
ncbi:MAG: hypothetical protein DRO67_07555 [Candidatus Asgardarchaeum californiense]|nr:MAG: hypothetical protein DRO67_07555 [Candidatus Asgardarchaeum californiense]